MRAKDSSLSPSRIDREEVKNRPVISRDDTSLCVKISWKNLQHSLFPRNSYSSPLASLSRNLSYFFFCFLFLIYRLLAMKNRHFAAEIRFFSALRISIEVSSILLSERNVRLRTNIILHFGVFSPSLALCIPFSPTLLHSLSLSFFFAKGCASIFAFYLFYSEQRDNGTPARRENHLRCWCMCVLYKGKKACGKTCRRSRYIDIQAITCHATNA